MEKELDNAEDILNNQLSEPILIHNTITTRDTDRGFSGLDAWQPLGITAAAGEKIKLLRRTQYNGDLDPTQTFSL